MKSYHLHFEFNVDMHLSQTPKYEYKVVLFINYVFFISRQTYVFLL